LKEKDLILFDDANHSTSEPFKFYEKLIENDQFQNIVRYVFIEVFPMNMQPSVDAYLSADTEDRTLLYPAFQNDYSGSGWRYESYFDLLHTIYNVNKTLPSDKRFKVICTCGPVYRSALKTPADLDLFRKSLVSFDYTMYQNILNKLDGFKSGRKGIFLTNTRHAYKWIRNSGGELYWNCGTFFAQWLPGKTYSIRIHNTAFFLKM
jgi:hypothetical protein